jgi:hypothetical protein
MPIVFGAIGIVLAVGARWMREGHQESPPELTVPPAPVAPAAAEQDPSEPPEPNATQSPEELPEELPLGDKDKARLRRGQGMLEVVAGRSDTILVDGKEAGQGPVVKIALEAGDEPHEVRVKMRGEERVRYVVVKEATRVRLRVAPPWSQ